MGIRRLLRGGPGGTAGPILLSVFGLGMIAGGIFTTDSVEGFPPDTPSATQPSTSGMLHFTLGGIGFLCLVAACFVIARRFPGLPWATYPRTTGAVFLLAFAAVATGPGFGIVAFTTGVLAAFTWLTATSLRLYQHADR
jgi:Protein of unknown function (DUF998)